MNQILVTKLKKNYRFLFKIQLIVSMVAIIGLIAYFMWDYKQTENMEDLSKVLNQNLKLSEIYGVEKQSTEKSLYLGKIMIPKIDLEYPVMQEFNEELLKIAPCKFYGANLGEMGNICIAGHNYNDYRFFSRIDELALEDEIQLMDLDGKEYTYQIFDIFEAEANDVTRVIKKTVNYELTLLTCNNSNKKRIIIKAALQT